MNSSNLAAFTTWACSAGWAFTLGHWVFGIVATAIAVFYAWPE